MFKIEMHAHCRPGSCDGRMDARQLLSWLRNHGYGGVLLTNHYDVYQLSKFELYCQFDCNFHCKDLCITRQNVLSLTHYDEEACYSKWLKALKDAQEYGKQIGIRVYCGMEYTLPDQQHVSLIGCSVNDFASDFIEPGKDIKYLRWYADKYDALLILNHPFRGNMNPQVWGIDGYECINTKYKNKEAFYPSELKGINDQLKGIYVCGGDVHSMEDIGRNFMAFSKELQDEHDLANHLRYKQYHMEARMFRDEDNTYSIIYT